MRLRWTLGMGAMAFAAAAAADTVHLTSGVSVDGAVTRPNENCVVVEMDGGSLTLQTSEVARIDKNDKKGRFVNPMAAQHELAVQERTGLTAEQREVVEALLEPLKSEDGAARAKARKALLAKARELDLFPYLAESQASSSGLYAPHLLEVLVELDKAKARPLVREACQAADPAIRAKGVELLGQSKDPAELGRVARGLVDRNADVQATAAHALRELNDRRATPVLIAALGSNNGRVRNASLAALTRLWKGVTVPEATDAEAAWKEWWVAQSKTVKEPLELAALRPLTEVAPGEHVAEYHNE